MDDVANVSNEWRHTWAEVFTLGHTTANISSCITYSPPFNFSGGLDSMVTSSSPLQQRGEKYVNHLKIWLIFPKHRLVTYVIGKARGSVDHTLLMLCCCRQDCCVNHMFFRS